METFIYLIASVPIFVALIYSVTHVLCYHERKNHLRHIILVVGGAVAAWCFAVFIKNIVEHPRPDLTEALFIPNDPYSFPSGHATFMFTLSFVMYVCDRFAAKVLFVLAVVTGVARVLAGVHYWYDIIGGVFVALLVAAGINFLTKKYIKR